MEKFLFGFAVILGSGCCSCFVIVVVVVSNVLSFRSGLFRNGKDWLMSWSRLCRRR
jgi:hypothetical protein